MWTQYRRTFWPVQVLAVAVTLGAVLEAGVPVGLAVLKFGLPMEVFALVGAAWAARLKAKVEARGDGGSVRRIGRR